ncbi:MAG: divalent-cation tolerance protein CutA [Candidatus Kapaibacterium sp.]
MIKTTDFCVIYVTAVSYDAAKNISKILVSEKLAACCSVISNITSTFGWEGAIQQRNEFLIIIKTKKDKFDSVKNRVMEMHSDEVPEIISVPLDNGLDSYLDWMNTAVSE